MDADLANRTLDRASSALKEAKVSCLPEIVKLLRTLSGKSEEISVAELAEVIQNDPLVTTKVMGAANTFGYNPNGVPVTSIVQAIHVIGYERIRSLTMSLMMAEQASRTQTSEEQREIATQSLVSGCLAQSIAGSRMLLDKEQAFICGCLRNFGHVVLTACMFDEYKQVRTEAGGLPGDEDYRRTFGMTPLELGHQLLKAANLPEEILVTLRAMPPEAFAVLETKPDEQMLALIDCSSRLARLACDPAIKTDEFAARSVEIARLYEKALPNLAEEVPAMMMAATLQLDHMVRTFRLRSLPLRTLNRVRACRNAVDPDRPKPAEPAPVPAANAAAAPPPAPPPEPVAVVAPVPVPAKPVAEPAVTPPGTLALPDHDWQASLNALAALLREPGVSTEKLHRALLEIVRTGLGATDCLLFSQRLGSDECPLVLGCGRLHELLQARPGLAIRGSERTVFGVCFQRRENIIIHHTHDPKIVAYLPAWLKEREEVGAFVLLPLTDGVNAEGVMLVGWADACRIVLPPECVRSIRSMIAFVCKTRARLAA